MKGGRGHAMTHVTQFSRKLTAIQKSTLVILNHLMVFLKSMEGNRGRKKILREVPQLLDHSAFDYTLFHKIVFYFSSYAYFWHLFSCYNAALINRKCQNSIFSKTKQNCCELVSGTNRSINKCALEKTANGVFMRKGIAS